MADPQVRAAVAAAVEAALRSISVPRLVPATVVDFNDVTGTATVVVDGDSDPIEVQSLLGHVLETDRRVMVTFQPPHGAFITGVIGLWP